MKKASKNLKKSQDDPIENSFYQKLRIHMRTHYDRFIQAITKEGVECDLEARRKCKTTTNN